MIRNPSLPVGPDNPYTRYTLLGGPTERQLEALGTFEREEDVEAAAAANRGRYAALVIQTSTLFRPAAEKGSRHAVPAVPVIGEVRGDRIHLYPCAATLLPELFGDQARGVRS